MRYLPILWLAIAGSLLPSIARAQSNCPFPGFNATTCAISLPGIGAAATANNLSDLANVSTARVNLGLTAAATTAIGTSGATIPLLSGANTWSAAQTMQSTLTVTGNLSANLFTPTGCANLGTIGTVAYGCNAGDGVVIADPTGTAFRTYTLGTSTPDLAVVTAGLTAAGYLHSGASDSVTSYLHVNAPTGTTTPCSIDLNGVQFFYCDQYGDAIAKAQLIGGTGLSAAGYATPLAASAAIGYNCSADGGECLYLYSGGSTHTGGWEFKYSINGTFVQVANVSPAGLGTFAGINNTGTKQSPVASYAAAFPFGPGMDAAEVSNTSATAYAATLPTCNAAIKGVGYQIVKTDANTNPINLTASGTDTISGSAIVAVNAQWTAVQVKCDGNGTWVRGLN